MGIHLLLFLLSVTAGTSPARSLNDDGVALLALYKRFVPPPPAISGWNSSDSSPCGWSGVLCGDDGRVAFLNLSNLGISTLGPEIGRLSGLRQLFLNGNRLAGGIPPELGNCSLMEYLDISAGGISGEIPATFQNLRKLSYLSLYDNALVGEIPAWLFHLPSLSTLYLHRNNLSGEIPSAIGNASELTALWLNGNSLSGFLPSSIGNLSKLQELYLQDNQLEGVLPSSLLTLRGLVFLYLKKNNFRGEILSLGSATFPAIREIDLSTNRFSGGIPAGIGNWSSLVVFAVTRNNLSGPVPSSFGSLRNLSQLFLAENRLSGKIPPEIGSCRALTMLHLQNNQLQGALPPELGKLIGLKSLRLFSNKLTGEVPKEIWSIPAQESLLLYDNDFSGEVPPEVAELRQLKNITLFDNHFTGEIPRGLGANSSLEIVDLTNNSFVGEIPPFICSGKKLWALALGSNLLSGGIKSALGGCSSLKRLILENNSFTGALPDFAANSSLQFLDLSGNLLNGSIPTSLGNCENISSINLSMNELEGSIPPEIGRLKKLEALNLSSNRFSGQIPPEISSCSRIYTLDLGFNSLNGSLPASMASLIQLTQLNVQENRLTGGIPDFLSRFSRLYKLELGGNAFGGRIPSSLGSLQNLDAALNLSGNGLSGDLSFLVNLQKLRSLDLSRNSLTGDLSPLENIHLEFLNVSDNDLAGAVPESLWPLLISSPSSFVGNPGLCVPCQSGDGRPVCSANTGFSSCAGRRRLSRVHAIAIAVSLSVFCLVLFVFLFSAYALYWKKRGRDAGPDPALSEVTSLPPLLSEVMDATEDLDEKYIIGRGAHGTVYRAQLTRGDTYAVKKLAFRKQTGSSASMKREIETIGKIKHRNLVKLVDFWVADDFGLIVYDFMENGSLHDVLHQAKPPPALSWNLRHRIALGTAHALAYLHHDCDPCIIHRDIKPMNILLDAEMEPHVSDFGIAGILDQCSLTAESTGIVGTFGYIPPESGFSTRRTRESDVYSYGVVLLELITRKRANEPFFGEDADLVRWAISTLDGTIEVGRIADTDLFQEVAATGEMEELRSLLLLALRCVDRDPGRRPSMRDAVSLLERLRSRVSTSRSEGTRTPTTFI